jgi:S1-C subfamily serine protease
MIVGCFFTFAGCGGGNSKPSQQEIVEQSSPGVVQLIGTQKEETVAGTGIVVDAEKGLVLTNAHVVSGVSALKARVLDQADIPAQIVAQAPCDDLAVVRLVNPPSGLKALPLGDSGSAEVGDPVTVLGYPETVDASGAPQKVLSTTGTISQANTSAAPDPALPKYPSLIIHGAAVNHGDSGGPLVDDQGKVIGLNTLTGAGAGSGQIQGQYYAIGIDYAQGLLSRLEAGESIANLGWSLAPVSAEEINQVFGARLGQAVNEYLTAVDDTKGLVVLGVDPGSAVSTSGHITAGDYITKINGTPITSVQDVCDQALSAAPGSTLTLTGRYLFDARKYDKLPGDAFRQNITVP